MMLASFCLVVILGSLCFCAIKPQPIWVKAGLFSIVLVLLATTLELVFRVTPSFYRWDFSELTAYAPSQQNSGWGASHAAIFLKAALPLALLSYALWLSRKLPAYDMLAAYLFWWPSMTIAYTTAYALFMSWVQTQPVALQGSLLVTGVYKMSLLIFYGQTLSTAAILILAATVIIPRTLRWIRYAL